MFKKVYVTVELCWRCTSFSSFLISPLSPPMSLRQRGHQNGRLDGADDVEEDEEAEVTGIADDGWAV